MTADYHTAQGDFSSIVYRLPPMALTNFVMWLDLKVAEFKVYGQMLLDQQDASVSKWFLRHANSNPDIMPTAKQKPKVQPNIKGCERLKRPATSTATKSHIGVSPTSKQQKMNINSDNEVIDLDSKTILPLEATSMMEELDELQNEVSSYLSSTQNSNTRSQSPKFNLRMSDNVAQPEDQDVLKQDLEMDDPLRGNTTHVVGTSQDESSKSYPNVLESSDNSRTAYSKLSHTHLPSSCTATNPLDSKNLESKSSQSSSQITGGTSHTQSSQAWSEPTSSEMDLILKVEPADEEFDRIEKTKSEFPEISGMDNSMLNTSEGDSFSSESFGHVVEKGNAMYLEEGVRQHFTDDKAAGLLNCYNNAEWNMGRVSSGHRCRICGKIFTQKRYMMQHMSKHGGSSHQCKICEKKFKWKSALCRHVKYNHNMVYC